MISGLLMGFGYMWDLKNQRMWPGLMKKILQLKSDFFGHFGGPGIWVHDYHWKRAIGLLEKRTDPTPRFHGLDWGDLNDDNRWGTRNQVVIQETENKIESPITLSLPAHSITSVMMKQKGR
jgi:alpha-L-arabinofuranosidase